MTRTDQHTNETETEAVSLFLLKWLVDHIRSRRKSGTAHTGSKLPQQESVEMRKLTKCTEQNRTLNTGLPNAEPRVM